MRAGDAVRLPARVPAEAGGERDPAALRRRRAGGDGRQAGVETDDDATMQRSGAS